MAAMGNAANASKIPNQANIVTTINAKISMADTIIDVIIKASAKNKLSSANMTKNMVNYRNTVNAILGKDGIIEAYLTGSDNMIKLNKTKSSDQKAAMSMIINFQKEIEVLIKGLSKLKITDDQIKKIVSNLKPINYLSEAIAKNGIDKTLVTAAIASFEPFNKLLGTISKIFESVNKLAAPKLLGIKIRLIRWYLRRLTFLTASIAMFNGMAPMFWGAMLALKQFSVITGAISKVFDDINGTKLGLKTFIKLKIIPRMLRRLIRIVIAVNTIASIIRMMKGVRDVLVIATVFHFIDVIFSTIRGIPVGMFIGIKIRRIAKALRLLHKVLRQIRRIRVRASSIMKLLVIKMMMTALALMFISIILLTPIAILVIPALLILWGAMLVIRLLVNAIIKIIVKMARNAILGFLAILIITSLLTTIAVMLFIVALVSQKVVKSTLWILGLLGVIMIVALFAAGIGILLSALGPFALILVAGLALIALVVGLLLVIGTMLLMLQVLNIDPDAVKESVECIINTAMYVVTAIFGVKDANAEKSNKSWLGSIVKFIGGSLVTVLSAIMSVYFLATMVAAILMVLLIAAELRLLQELKLDPEKIKENVGIVISTAQEIIKAIFDSPDTKAKASEKTWLRSIVEFVGGAIVTVISAVLAMHYLTTMVAAIFAILLIVTELRLLQNLNLKPNRIKENVDIVISAAQYIIDILFGTPDTSSESSNKPWIKSVFEFIGGGITQIVGAVMAVQFLATTMVAIFFIIIIAKELKKIEDIGVSDKIKDNVGLIISTAQSVIDSVMLKKGINSEKADDEKKGWFKSALKFIGGGFMNLLGAFTSMVWFGQAMIVVSLVRSLAEHLSYISDIKLAPNINSKVNSITRAANDVVKAMVGKKSGKETLELSDVNTVKADSIKDLCPTIKDQAKALTRIPFIADAIITVSSIKCLSDTIDLIKDLPDHSDAVKKAGNVRKTVDDILNQIKSEPIKLDDTSIGASDRISYIERISASIKSITDISDAKLKKTRRATEGHINLLKEINKVDGSKLSTTASMFESMARFSESVSGNFDKLADTLNERILPNLETLKSLIDGLPDNFKTALKEVEIGMQLPEYNKTASEGFLNSLKNDGWDDDKLKNIKQQMSTNADSIDSPELLMQIVGILMQLSNGTAFKTTTV